MPVKHRNWIISAAILGLLAACAEKEVILPGKREALRDVLSDTAVTEAEAAASNANQSLPIRLGSQQRNDSWVNSPVSPRHRTDHPALGTTLSLAWSATIGEGDSRRNRITADPVVAQGRVFTLDALATVAATSTGGATIWSRDLTPPRDNAGEVSGGGLAYGDGKLFVTTGTGQLTALDPATGQEIWVQDLDASGTGTPTYNDGLVYLVSGDSTAWAIEADSGRVRWQLDSLTDINNVAGGPAPAISDRLVIFGYGSGEVQGAFLQGGLSLWNASVVGQREGRAIAQVGDLTGDPMISGNKVYAANFTGRLVALNKDNGQRIWTAREGAVGMAWPAGDSLFTISDLGELVRLNANDGTRIWAVELPRYVKERPRKRSRVFAHHGPIVAGGRVIVASDDGLLRQYNPTDGALIGTVQIPGGATTNPIVVNGTLYVVSQDGKLLAFR